MMGRGFGRFLLALMLVLPIAFTGNGGQSSMFAYADNDDDVGEEDAVDGEDDGMVDTDGEDATTDDAETDPSTTDDKGEETAEEDSGALKASPDAKTLILFTKPISNSEFPAGSPVHFLVGFANKGAKTFIVDSIDASFRYPQDYSFYIQNFTTNNYMQEVKASYQATFKYSFVPSDTFNARPFGLTVNVNYKDLEGNMFQDAVFNETVQITEPNEGLDGETFFLYVLIAAGAVLLLVGAQQLLSSFGRKRLSKPKAAVEMGTQNNSEVDYDWIPKETLEMNNKSPRRSPRQSPRQRKANRSTGSDD